LLVMCAIGGVGLFISVAWAFSAITASDRWVPGMQAPTRSGGPAPELRNAAAQAVSRAAQAVKRHRTT
jgi:hypothetical protein